MNLENSRLARQRLLNNWLDSRSVITAQLGILPAPRDDEITFFKYFLERNLIHKGELTLLFSQEKRLTNWLLYYHIKKAILLGQLFFSEIEFIDFNNLLINVFGYSDNGEIIGKLNNPYKKLIIIQDYYKAPGKNFEMLKEHLGKNLFSQKQKSIIITNGNMGLNIMYDFKDLQEQHGVNFFDLTSIYKKMPQSKK